MTEAPTLTFVHWLFICVIAMGFTGVAVFIGYTIPAWIKARLAAYTPPRIEPAWRDFDDEDPDQVDTEPVRRTFVKASSLDEAAAPDRN